MIRRILAALGAARHLRRAKAAPVWACVNPACKGNNPFLSRHCPLGRSTCPLDLVHATDADADAIRGTADITAGQDDDGLCGDWADPPSGQLLGKES